MNKPGLATYSTFWDDGHMSNSSFPGAGRVQQLAPSPRLAAADAILQRLRKKPSFPSFPLVAKGSLLSQVGLFRVWVVTLEEDFLAGLVQEALLSSLTPNHCPSSHAAGLTGRPWGSGATRLLLTLTPTQAREMPATLCRILTSPTGAARPRWRGRALTGLLLLPLWESPLRACSP